MGAVSKHAYGVDRYVPEQIAALHSVTYART